MAKHEKALEAQLPDLLHEAKVKTVVTVAAYLAGIGTIDSLPPGIPQNSIEYLIEVRERLAKLDSRKKKTVAVAAE